MVGGKYTIIKITSTMISMHTTNFHRPELFLRSGICIPFFYIVSNPAINTPAAAMIINGGAIIASNGGSVPFAPSALKIFNKKYKTKQVRIPMANFVPKLWLRRWCVCENATPSVAIAIIVSGKNNSVQN